MSTFFVKCILIVSLIYFIITVCVVYTELLALNNISKYKDTCCHYDTFRNLEICRNIHPKNYDSIDDDNIYAYCIQTPPTDVFQIMWFIWGSTFYILFIGIGFYNK